MIVVKFKFDLKDLKLAHFWVDEAYLPIVNGEAAEYFADDAEDFVAQWRIHGPTGASLEVSMTVGDAPAKAIVKSVIRATDDGMRSDANVIKLGVA